MATAPTCMWALRSSSSRKSESRALRRSYQVSMPSPAYLLTMPVADGPNPMHVAAPHGFRTDSPADDPDAEDPRVARANLPRPWVQAGDVLQISVDWTIASELAWNGMERTYSMLGRPKLHDKDRFFLAVDHTVDPVTLANDKRAQKLVQLSRTFAKESGIRHFSDANQTILHTRVYRDLV